MSGGTILIVGATSAIARGVADAFARRGYGLYLAARCREEMERIAADLRVRYGVAVRCAVFDAEDAISEDAMSGDAMSADALVARAIGETGDRFAGVVVAVGQLGDHARAVERFAHAREIIDVNFVAVAGVLSVAANHFEARRRGFLAALSSVAGDRGRQSNYVYGSAKGALTVFLQGLRNRLARSGVRVHTLKLGYVDTQMTYGRIGGALAVGPRDAGERIVRAIERGKDVAYVPGFWRVVMGGITLVPEAVFKRMSL